MSYVEQIFKRKYSLLFATPDTEAAIFQMEPCKIYFQVPYRRAQKPPGVQWIRAT